MQLVLPRAAPVLRAQHETTTDDEAQLVARARRGEISALDELMNCHRARILNLAFQVTHDRDIAEDCAQEAFVRAFSKLNLFRGQSSFGTWLYRIALNVALEKQRQMLTIRRSAARDLKGNIERDVEPGHRMENGGAAAAETLRDVAAETLRDVAAPRDVAAETLRDVAAPPRDLDARMALEWALDQLSAPLRIALILREWHGLSYQEMASVCGVPVGTIRSRLSAARAEFRRVWTQMESS